MEAKTGWADLPSSADQDIKHGIGVNSGTASFGNPEPVKKFKSASPHDSKPFDIAALIGTADEFVTYSEAKECNVFKGTDTPVSYLFQSILHGETINDFMADFPLVNENDILGVIRLAAHAVR